MQEGNNRILTLKQKKFCADGDIGGLSDHVGLSFHFLYEVCTCEFVVNYVGGIE